MYIFRLFLLHLFFSTSLFSAGFTGDILILTDQGQVQLQKIQLQDTILAENDSVQTVAHITTKTIPSALCIEVADETIICHPDQLFWSVDANKFVPAKKLEIGDFLLTFDNQQLAIDSISPINQETVVYSISVTNPHHLFVGKPMVLAHNFFDAVAAVVGVTISFGAGIEIYATISAGLAFCGALIGLSWGKKDNEPVVCRPTFGHGNDLIPQFHYASSEHPNGIYEPSPKHSTKQQGNISPLPKDGQKALDISIPLPGKRRIAVCDGEFVVLSYTTEKPCHDHDDRREKVYHGHVESWDTLRDEMQDALKKAGLVTSKGKIICKEK